MSLVDYRAWIREVYETNYEYRELFKNGEAHPPIFFFGDPNGAVAATVGVNPSAEEFIPARGWGPEYENSDLLIQRCRMYFDNPKGISPHPWFSIWKDFLNKIGLSYRTDPRAIHLDLSPRATRSMSSLQRGSKKLLNLFLDLVEHDSKYLFEQLRTFKAIKHLYVAGSVTKKYYLIEFLENRQRELGCRLKTLVPFRRGSQGKLGLYTIDVGDNLPRYLFFCSTSPSARVRPHPLPQKARWLIDKYPEFAP